MIEASDTINTNSSASNMERTEALDEDSDRNANVSEVNISSQITYTKEDLEYIQDQKKQNIEILKSYLTTVNFYGVYEDGNKYKSIGTINKLKKNTLKMLGRYETSTDAALIYDQHVIQNRNNRLTVEKLDSDKLNFPHISKFVARSIYNNDSEFFTQSIITIDSKITSYVNKINELRNLNQTEQIKQKINRYGKLNQKEKINKKCIIENKKLSQSIITINSNIEGHTNIINELRKLNQTEEINQKINHYIEQKKIEENQLIILTHKMNDLELERIKYYIQSIKRSENHTQNQLVLDEINKLEEINKLDRIQKVEELEKLKEINSKKRCFIIGNGPSLKEIDLSLLKNEVTIGSNYLMNGLAEAKSNFFPTILCSGDGTCTEKIINKDNIHLINTNTILITHPSSCIFRKVDADNTPYYSNLKQNEIDYFFIKHFDEFSLSKQFISSYDFMINRNSYCIIYRNVVSMIGMLIAEKLGFKEIYLLGCDMNNFTNHFYNYKSHTRFNLDPLSTFDYSVEGYESVYKAFGLRKTEFDEKNINVYNCSKNSSLTMFEKVDFNNVIKRTAIED